jgi:hypothetical protein
VFTPVKTVNEMLDLLPSEMWDSHPSPTFLEPACGDGNFLVAILRRKLSRIMRQTQETLDQAELRADEVLMLGLEAAGAIYAVDISIDNVIGGTPGHEIGARQRLLSIVEGWATPHLSSTNVDPVTYLLSAEWIFTHNILIGNMLASDSDGKPTGRDAMSVMEYSWDLDHGSVSISRTTMGDIISATSGESLEMLWGAPEPVKHWEGDFMALSTAPAVVNPFETRTA